MKKATLIFILFIAFSGIVTAAGIHGDYKGKPIVLLQSRGKTLEVTDVPAHIVDRRTLVPISMLRQLGVEVTWNPDQYIVDVKMPESLDQLLERLEKAAKAHNGHDLTFVYSHAQKTLTIQMATTSEPDKTDQIIGLMSLIADTPFHQANIVERKNNEPVATYSAYRHAVQRYLDKDISKVDFIESWEVDRLDAKGRRKPLSSVDIAKLRDRVGYIEIRDENGELISLGSCFLIRNHILITNYHVWAAGQKMTVHIGDISFDMENWRLFGNEDTDVYGVQLIRDGVTRHPVFGELPAQYLEYTTELPLVGETVYAIGAPAGLPNTISKGIVSSIREIDGKIYIQHTAETEPGSSGGVLLNEYGEAIGITSMGIPYTTYEFAVPMMYVQEELDRLGLGLDEDGD